MKPTLIFLVVSFISFCASYRLVPTKSLKSIQTSSISNHRKLSMLSLDSFLVAAVEVNTKPADYQYGAVSAPTWVLPLGAAIAIISAALPILLRPGEEALNQQRENEKVKGSEFNKRQGKKL